MSEPASITFIEIRRGGLVLTLDSGARIRPVPWTELRQVYARPAELTLWWEPTPEDREHAARLDAEFGVAEGPQECGYWPGEETIDRPDKEFVKPARRMHRRIMRAWRRWARERVGG